LQIRSGVSFSQVFLTALAVLFLAGAVHAEPLRTGPGKTDGKPASLKPVNVKSAGILPASPKAEGRLPASSFKGYELYSIEPRGPSKGKYSLLIGTNRIKSSDEVKASPLTEAELVKSLNQLDSGQWVTWIASERQLTGLRLPIKDEVVRIKAVCEKRGLHLQLQDDSWVK
jgi:hypothetical protein